MIEKIQEIFASQSLPIRTYFTFDQQKDTDPCPCVMMSAGIYFGSSLVIRVGSGADRNVYIAGDGFNRNEGVTHFWFGT